MTNRKEIFVIIGSAGENSANERLVEYISQTSKDLFNLTIFKDLKRLPHFDPELSLHNPPPEITDVRNKIEKSDGVIICTPEYIFSIPSGLKNLIEWCVVTTIFSKKPTGLITASASGLKGHEELKLIMKTVMAEFSEHTTLLIQGVKGKINQGGELTDQKTIESLNEFVLHFCKAVNEGMNASH